MSAMEVQSLPSPSHLALAHRSEAVRLTKIKKKRPEYTGNALACPASHLIFRITFQSGRLQRSDVYTELHLGV